MVTDLKKVSEKNSSHLLFPSVMWCFGAMATAILIFSVPTFFLSALKKGLL